ncbi:serine hydrolase-domain-containing protein [Hypoxylon cercidicola]|nr:serine hydrolase-domain-containing protein [Hypoxylon cercidicola]
MSLFIRRRPTIYLHLPKPSVPRPIASLRPLTSIMSAPRPTPTVPAGKTEVKILMLHGYTQSGALFSSKTKALAKLLTKTLSPLSLHPTLVFPTGPFRLRPSDIPGYDLSGDPAEGDEDEDSDTWAWYRKDEATGAYRGLEQGMEAVAAAVRDAGGVDGVCGFSQGGAMAALVASALEHPLRTPPAGGESPSSAGETADWSWVESLRAANGGRPLKFCIVYSGYYAPLDALRWMYEPKIATPSLQFVGSLDTVVDETRTQGLIDRSQDPQVVVHPGGHYVPVARDWVMVLAGWLKQRYENK